MAQINDLPLEILIQVIECCDTSRDIAALASTSKHLYNIALPLLYNRQLDNNDHHVTFWAAKKGIIETLRHVRRHMTLQVFICSKKSYDTSGNFDSEKQRSNGWFWTPLHEAVKGGHFETVQFLLDNGADINAPSLCFHDMDLGITEAKYHVDFGDRLSFEVLPLVTFSPLITSIYYRHDRITELLLSRGASIQIKDVRKLQPCGTTALHIAVVNANIEAIKLLVEGGHVGPNDLDAAGFPPLVWAALHVRADERVRSSIKTLVELGADLNCGMPSDPWLGSNHTVVTFLTKRGKADAAQELINLGARALTDQNSTA
ncbi:hypothetical protein NW762_001628 [Fusarium torreyae]|uniref:F-box domain-containing protein n=1 Tax=Fusarium torreyae TaxID=1237075 RepID=A0A9W8SG07_9HYPO|nr:hypothetical protein NW762_001628 [Fusarium torreyae]